MADICSFRPSLTFSSFSLHINHRCRKRTEGAPAPHPAGSQLPLPLLPDPSPDRCTPPPPRGDSPRRPSHDTPSPGLRKRAISRPAMSGKWAHFLDPPLQRGGLADAAARGLPKAGPFNLCARGAESWWCCSDSVSDSDSVHLIDSDSGSDGTLT